MGGPRDELIRRLHGSGFDADTRALVLAACDGADEPGGPAPSPSAADDVTVPRGDGAAWLRSITVEGFRGIGPKTTLSFPAGPGLTLVVGRNGSGKSSFAEALELLLTGDSRRWYKRTSIWKEGWQNLHHPGDVAIRAEFDVAGSAGPLAVWRTWAPGVALGAAAPATAQIKGEPQGPCAAASPGSSRPAPAGSSSGWGVSERRPTISTPPGGRTPAKPESWPSFSTRPSGGTNTGPGRPARCAARSASSTNRGGERRRPGSPTCGSEPGRRTSPSGRPARSSPRRWRSSTRRRR